MRAKILKNAFDQFFPAPIEAWQQFADVYTVKHYTKVEVYSLTGNLILTQKVMENAVIDISDIPSGIYLVKIFENDILLSVQRLIKAN